MKTAEYLAASQNRKTAIAARMNELVSTTTEAGTTMDAAQAQEFDDLKLELKNLDAHIARLNDVEEINRASAQPVGGATPQDGAAARDVTRVVQVKDNRPEYSDFIRYAMVLATAKGNIPLAYEMSKSRYPDCPRIHTILKAAVSAGTTTDTTWAGALVQYQNFAGDFIDYLRPQTIVGRIPGLRRVPFNIQVGGQTSGGSASWVGQG
jgi:HK97 family phage major capsid protein